MTRAMAVLMYWPWPRGFFEMEEFAGRARGGSDKLDVFALYYAKINLELCLGSRSTDVRRVFCT